MSVGTSDRASSVESTSENSDRTLNAPRKREALYSAFYKRLNEVAADQDERPSIELAAEIMNLSAGTVKRTLHGKTKPSPSTEQAFILFLSIDRDRWQQLYLFEESGEADPRVSTATNNADELHQIDRPSDVDSPFSERHNSESKSGTLSINTAYEWINSTSSVQRVVALIASLFVVAFSWFLVKDPAVCVIDLRVKLVSIANCPGNVSMRISGLDLNPWNGKLSALDVPEGWTVRAKYEKWEPPNYEYIDPNGNGFVLLKTGLNLLHESTYQLYRDLERTDFIKITGVGELNDRIQYLVISTSTVGELRLFAHKELDNPDQLKISRVLN